MSDAIMPLTISLFMVFCRIYILFHLRTAIKSNDRQCLIISEKCFEIKDARAIEHFPSSDVSHNLFVTAVNVALLVLPSRFRFVKNSTNKMSNLSR